MRGATQDFVVRSGHGTISREYDHGDPMLEFTDSIERVERVPREHSGWQSVTYKKKRYQLHGGCHVFWFICLTSPIGGHSK